MVASFEFRRPLLKNDDLDEISQRPPVHAFPDMFRPVGGSTPIHGSPSLHRFRTFTRHRHARLDEGTESEDMASHGTRMLAWGIALTVISPIRLAVQNHPMDAPRRHGSSRHRDDHRRLAGKETKNEPSK